MDDSSTGKLKMFIFAGKLSVSRLTFEPDKYRLIQLYRKFRNLRFDKKNKVFYDVGLFFTIILVFHVIWRIWEYKFYFHFLGFDFMSPAIYGMLKIIREQSAWILTHILGYETIIRGELLVHDDYYRLGVTFGCSGLKQFYQFTAIIIFFYGSWKRKIWFWALSLLILHFVNITRIISLFLVSIYRLNWFDPIHDWFFRPLFYVVMFLLWVWWVEKLAVKNLHEQQPAIN